jgi:hypothetical protein
MPLMISELYDALLEAGASEEKARKAAESVADYEAQFSRFENDMMHVRTNVEHIQQRLTHLMWSIGIGFSVMMVVLVTELNWLWQLMQRVR